MMTPQDIREKTFEKAVFGGYDMGSVDDFLDEIFNDYTALSKENTVLKGKLKVLVEKIEEYRATEDAMRLALLNAQRLGAQMEADAREKSAAAVAQAQAEAQRVTTQAQQAVASEQARLAEAQQASAEFIDNMRLLCSKQLTFLDAVSKKTFPAKAEEVKPEPPKAKADSIDDTLKSIEDSVARATAEPVMDIDVSGSSAGETDEPTLLFSIASEPADATDAPTSKFTFTRVELDADKRARQE